MISNALLRRGVRQLTKELQGQALEHLRQAKKHKALQVQPWSKT